MTSHSAEPATRVLILGATGMLGSALVHELSRDPRLEVRGAARSLGSIPKAFSEAHRMRLREGIDVLDEVSRRKVIGDADVVVNAVGVIKQAPGLDDSIDTVRINALLPHELAADCAVGGTRLIHVSTDCVFSGRRGLYSEEDVPDPIDFYGRSKLLGELPSPALTLRTSIIGPELQRHASLLDWFLRQPQTIVRGFRRAIYTGITTLEFARLLRDFVIPDPSLGGLYHVASAPISKLDLLRTVAETYGWGGEILPDDDFRCDRSMTAERLSETTGYMPPSWPKMIQEQYDARPPWALVPSKEATA